MSEETLFTAARRAVRDYNIDMHGGGLMSVRTQQSMEILKREVTSIESAEKARREAAKIEKARASSATEDPDGKASE